MKSRGSQRLAVRLARVCVLIAFTLGVILSVTQVARDFVHEDQAVDSIIAQILSVAEGPSRNAAYTLDQEVAREVVEGLLQYEFVVVAGIEDEWATQLAVAEKSGVAEQPLRWVTRTFSQEFATHRVTLLDEKHGQEILGYLTVVVDRHAVLADFIERSRFVLLAGILRNLLLALLLYLAFHLILTKPLTELAGKLSGARPDGEGQGRVSVPSGHEGDELGTLITSINTFMDSNEAYLRDRARAEDALRELTAELEERVRRRTAELERSNKDLESFCYSVSHDLRAPLRHISGYVGMLEDRLGEELDDESKKLMGSVERSVSRMGRMIEDLLRLSRVGRKEMELKQVDVNALVHETRASLSPEIDNRDIVWRIQDMAPVRGDEGMLRLALENLLQNALKFTRDRQKAVIEVGSREDPAPSGQRVFYVRDNGVGFDPRHADKLFGVFQRLHSEVEFEGLGVGLAIVDRVASRHAGRAWAEGDVDKGATFYFSLNDGA